MKGRLIFVEHHANWLSAFEAFFVTLECQKSFHISGLGAIEVIDRSLEESANEKIVLVTDYSMQVMDGLELCKKYRDNKNVVKVIFSNIIEDDEIKQALNDGIIDKYVKKDLGEALEKLSGYIEGQLST